MHPHYNVANYPIFVCDHGNWAIPNRRGRAFGCRASHFGDAGYVRATLGVDPMAKGENAQ
jgi:hypothetical protein